MDLRNRRDRVSADSDLDEAETLTPLKPTSATDSDPPRSRSWHGAETSCPRPPEAGRHVSQPALSVNSDSDEQKKLRAAPKCRFRPIQCFIKLTSSFCSRILRTGWGCTNGLLQQMNSLVHSAYCFLKRHGVYLNEELMVDKKIGGRSEGNDDMIEMMEAQIKTLLEINKFLREEIATIKEERELAEEIVHKIETKCREAIDRNQDSVNAHELFEMLYGVGSAQKAFNQEEPRPKAAAKDDAFRLTDDCPQGPKPRPLTPFQPCDFDDGLISTDGTPSPVEQPEITPRPIPPLFSTPVEPGRITELNADGQEIHRTPSPQPPPNQSSFFDSAERPPPFLFNAPLPPFPFPPGPGRRYAHATVFNTFPILSFRAAQNVEVIDDSSINMGVGMENVGPSSTSQTRSPRTASEVGNDNMFPNSPPEKRLKVDKDVKVKENVSRPNGEPKESPKPL